MSRSHVLQPRLPRLEADGQTHARECECPRCDAGFGPSEAERALAARRQEEERLRQAAEEALQRRRRRRRARAMALRLELEAEERRTAAYLAEQAATFRRLQGDRRLDALLASREAGTPAPDAIAEVERRFDRRRGPGGS